MKKQVENYQRFKLQRLRCGLAHADMRCSVYFLLFRSKSNLSASPGITVIGESPLRKKASDNSSSLLHRNGVCVCVRVCVCVLSPACVFPVAVCPATANTQARVTEAVATPSPRWAVTPGGGGGGGGGGLLTPRVVLKKEPSPATLQSLMLGRIPPHPSPLSHHQHLPEALVDGAASMVGGASSLVGGAAPLVGGAASLVGGAAPHRSRALRRLKYDSEEPLTAEEGQEGEGEGEGEGEEGEGEGEGEEGEGGGHLSGVEVSESYSMMAFSLSTPTRGQRMDFHQAFAREPGSSESS